MAKSKKSKVKILIKEFYGRGGVSDTGMPFGGFSPGWPAGTMRNNPPITRQPHQIDPAKQFSYEEVVSKVVKVVMYRNGHVLLLKNEEGWDLPGGHLRRGENDLQGLKREVFEETGLAVDEIDIKKLHFKHGKTHFYSTTFPRDDVQLSEEHSKYKFFPVEEALELKDLSSHFRDAILKTIGEDRPMMAEVIVRIG